MLDTCIRSEAQQFQKIAVFYQHVALPNITHLACSHFYMKYLQIHGLENLVQQMGQQYYLA